MNLPHVLVGDTRSASNVAMIKQLGWGRICLRDLPAPFEGERWGYDNGAYVSWVEGKPFDEDGFMRRLERAARMGTPIMAVTPDIVAGGLESLDYSLSWLPRLPSEWPWYLAVQDGMQLIDVAPHMHNFAGIFLGGSNRFKSTARSWRAFAHEHGKPFHYGRAGTLRKLEHAREIGADSLDSAFPLWTTERMHLFASRWRHGDPQSSLFRMLST